MEVVNHYQVLCVEATATPHEIKAAYHQAVLKHHPDKAGNDDSSDADFQRVQTAWEVLRDPHLREIHNRELNQASMQSVMTYADEIELYEMEESVLDGVQQYTHDCRCGDSYILLERDLEAVQCSIALPCR
mmetsp:Transcript_39782/g.88420  ORF Transcript_39782/g.88420 Transcript_39782/m.88420 type:complete len:131 (+) Transcript_39782:110-502(+)